MLRAEPELERADSAVDEPDPSTPMSDEERDRKQAAYRDYLTSQGLTPLREVLPTLEETESP